MKDYATLISAGFSCNSLLYWDNVNNTISQRFLLKNNGQLSKLADKIVSVIFLDFGGLVLPHVLTPSMYLCKDVLIICLLWRLKRSCQHDQSMGCVLLSH